jgi:hypothetical protein
VLLTVDLDKDLIDVEGVAIATVLSLQATSINRTKLDTPKADCFSGYGDAPLSQEVFYISVTEIKSVIEPDGVGNDVRWESVALVCIHHRIISFPGINLSVPLVAIPELRYLNDHELNAALGVIRGRITLNRPPETVIQSGSALFHRLWHRWRNIEEW